MFTSSFHPVEESPEDWVQQHIWNSTLIPTGTPFSALFMKKKEIKQKEFEKKGQLVLQHAIPYLGQDTAKLIVSYMDRKTLLNLVLTCKMNVVLPVTKISVTAKKVNNVSRTTPMVYSLPLENKQDVAKYLDLYTLSLQDITQKAMPMYNIVISESAKRIFQSVLNDLIERIMEISYRKCHSQRRRKPKKSIMPDIISYAIKLLLGHLIPPVELDPKEVKMYMGIQADKIGSFRIALSSSLWANEYKQTKVRSASKKKIALGELIF